ncbi:MAG: DoxX family protein [Gemmatimonadaceae bacterium]
MDASNNGLTTMNPVNISNLVLWSVQSFVAVFFISAGTPKVLGRGLERWTGFSDLPRTEVVFIGLAEVLGALGLVLPMATGILPWLTPLAALGLAVIVLLAAGFHLRANEYLQALEAGLWASISMVIAIGRWHAVAARTTVPAWVLVVALAVLVPAAIVNVIILLRRPAAGVARRNSPVFTT